MKLIFQAFILFGTIVFSTLAQQNCWWTGCQSQDWAVRGCAQYDMDEKGNKGCTDNRGRPGNQYYCCPRTGGSAPAPPPGGSGGVQLVTETQFRDAVTRNGYPAPSRDHYNSFNMYARTRGRISTLQEAAMALAQILHESDGLRAKKEYACAQSQCPNNYRDGRCDKPGQYYYGRGYIQLTWCYNYGPASQAIFRDDRLLTNPEQVATNDQTAWQTTFWFWSDRVHDKPGVQQGQFGATTRWINGDECRDPNNQVAQKRFRMYGVVRQAFGLQGNGDPSGCQL